MEEEQIIPASKETAKDPSGMNKGLVIAIVILLLLGIGGLAFWFGTQRKAPQPTQTSVETATPSESPSGSPTTTPKPTKTPKRHLLLLQLRLLYRLQYLKQRLLARQPL